ncbi:response regulator transcription factor [Pseudonocardia cypriaca]|uniref:DNA-binding response OmpR family regulator n=1 Tax=Pseudonocardia cypriaca TaxID=882449 RepID=A0A543FVH8_9PSEU|nr:response regulator transcription factor [Pseudonocardia cypriaca]TQM37858.1 DNA-binding response OmpR family regulator [Pseudonocardia cypriaca]
MALVLVVEDDHAVRRAMTEALRDAGHVVQPVGTASAALGALAKSKVDLIVLDLGLPDFDGDMALRYLRGASEVPVIIATARTDERTIVRLLEEGADDYITKPFSSQVLTARVGAVLRRSKVAEPDEPVRICDLVIDEVRREVTLRAEPVDLPRREFDLLAYLGARCGKVVSKEELAHNVWHASADRNIHQTIDVHVSWVRRKLGESAAEPRYIHTVRGVGYKLIDPCNASSSA